LSISLVLPRAALIVLQLFSPLEHHLLSLDRLFRASATFAWLEP
jgi:hypothetical protein